MVHSKSPQLFEREQEVIIQAETLLSGEGLTPEILLLQTQLMVGEYKKLLRQSSKLVKIGDAQQTFLRNLQKDLRDILDHTGQGLFTSDIHLLINENFSAECLKIFGAAIAHKRFTDLIREYNSRETVDLIEQILSADFFGQANPPTNLAVLFSLLPDELAFRERFYQVTYKLLQTEKGLDPRHIFMFIFSDITDRKILERQVAAEQQLFRKFSKISFDLTCFKRRIHEFRRFCREDLPAFPQKGQPLRTSLEELFRKLHTFKGDFSLYDMHTLSTALHAIESTVQSLLDGTTPLSAATARQALQGVQLESLLNPELAEINDLFGGILGETDEVLIDCRKLDRLERLLSQLTDPAAAHIQQEVRRLRHVDFRRLLAAYPDYVQELANKYEKQLAPLVIHAPTPVLVDETRYFPLVRSLVHVFRNAVYHGIETPERRLLAGKPESGVIRCAITSNRDSIFLEIADDGQGLNLERLKLAALAQGRLSADEAYALTAENATALIFLDGVTTSAIDETAGRGEGLAAVQSEVAALNGSIQVETHPGAGTRFVFSFPWGEDESPTSLSLIYEHSE